MSQDEIWPRSKGNLHAAKSNRPQLPKSRSRFAATRRRDARRTDGRFAPGLVGHARRSPRTPRRAEAGRRAAHRGPVWLTVTALSGRWVATAIGAGAVSESAPGILIFANGELARSADLTTVQPGVTSLLTRRSKPPQLARQRHTCHPSFDEHQLDSPRGINPHTQLHQQPATASRESLVRQLRVRTHRPAPQASCHEASPSHARRLPTVLAPGRSRRSPD